MKQSIVCGSLQPRLRTNDLDRFGGIEYQFFEGTLKNLKPNFGVIPYDLNASLFNDYSKKKRFVWMPNNTKATYINDNVPLDFPVGAILIKQSNNSRTPKFPANDLVSDKNNFSK